MMFLQVNNHCERDKSAESLTPNFCDQARIVLSYKYQSLCGGSGGVSVVSNETPFWIMSKRSDQELSQLTELFKLAT